jgi:Resolvase, N terminal domain/Recombinase
VTRNAVAYIFPSDGELDAGVVPDGTQVVAVIAAEDSPEREGLRRALESIAAGNANALLLLRLAHAAGSLGELVRLLDWLDGAGADLIAADVGLDTGSDAGRQIAAVLREVDSWGRDPVGPRRPRGRPGLAAGSPELAHRIADLRERGLSLQAIADALNAEGIPTPRGGSTWRPSSVQAALGYRRPRPPVPGAPPPPPPHHPGEPPGGPPPPRPHHRRP